MAETYETNLLRVIIGYLHVSLLEQLAVIRHGKGTQDITKEERDSLENEMLGVVLGVSRTVTDTRLQTLLKPPPIPDSAVH